jgi:hypothetical protein
MALWGNNDAKGAGGTVTLDYTTLKVTGTATTFGQVGAAATGNVIRFGSRTGTYFGDAVIVGITSATVLTIHSTAGLNGSAISGSAFQISESPKFAVLDSNFSRAGAANTEVVKVLVSAATTNAGIGTNIVFVNSLAGVVVGDTFTSNAITKTVTVVGATSVSLASTIATGIATASAITFTRITGGNNAKIYGVAEGGAAAAQGTKYALTHQGWVGVHTYIGSEGTLRVKSEVLVAMSGITTGNVPTFPPAS